MVAEAGQLIQPFFAMAAKRSADDMAPAAETPLPASSATSPDPEVAELQQRLERLKEEIKQKQKSKAENKVESKADEVGADKVGEHRSDNIQQSTAQSSDGGNTVQERIKNLEVMIRDSENQTEALKNTRKELVTTYEVSTPTLKGTKDRSPIPGKDNTEQHQAVNDETMENMLKSGAPDYT